MSLIAIKYRFDDFELDVTNRTLSYLQEVIPLQPKAFDILRFLVERAPLPVSKAQILDHIWPDAFVEESNIGVHLARIRKIFRDRQKEVKFIKRVSGGGYQFLREVTREEVIAEPQTQTIVVPGPRSIEINSSGLFSDHPVFILVTSLFYGMLFWLVLLLEVAYQFDVYGPSALWRGLSLFAWTGLTTFFGLFWMEERTKLRKKRPLVAGFAFLFIGGAIACLAMWRFVPLFPITAAATPTQTAFLAFCKNCLLYILPLGFAFILLPYHAVIARRYRSRPSLTRFRPVHLFAASVLTAIVSHLVTLNFAEVLRESDYRILFLLLIVLRFLLYFGLAVGCSFWFYLRYNEAHADGNVSVPVRSRIAWRLGTLLTLSGVGLLMFYTARPAGTTPQMYSLEVLERVEISLTHRTLRVKIEGRLFEPGRVFVRVVGEGCPAVSPCEVENDVLTENTLLTENKIEGVPLTLKKGEFLISVQNGDSHPSNSVVLLVE